MIWDNEMIKMIELQRLTWMEVESLARDRRKWKKEGTKSHTLYS